MTRSPTASALRFAAALSTQPDTAQAIDEVCAQAQSELGGAPHLAVVFTSHHHGPEFTAVAEAIAERTGAEHLVGATGEAIVGGAQEVEGRPALALWLAQLPGVTVRPMHLEFEETPEGGTFTGWPDDLPERWPEGCALLVLGEPFSFPADALLARLNEDQPGIPVVGGMASGGWGPGQNRVLWGRQDFDRGAVAVWISGPLRLRALVSQGCRPVGQHFVITRAERNVIQELGGTPPLAQLEAIYRGLPPREQKLIERGLHVGRVINEYQDQFGPGDFLVRNVMGADPGSGAIAVGDLVRAGQTVQFHVRDAQTADEDLRAVLSRARAQRAAPLGALLFTCNGRGTRLFDQPDHDAATLRQELGEIPTAGFFAQGELGPVGGKNFIHGFTASVVLFERGDDA